MALSSPQTRSIGIKNEMNVAHSLDKLICPQLVGSRAESVSFGEGEWAVDGECIVPLELN